MSIAVSVVVLPSRLLRLLLAAAAAGSAGVGLTILCGLVGDLPVLARCVIALGLFAIALLALRESSKKMPAQILDVSGQGQIRLSSSSNTDCAESAAAASRDDANLCRMLGNTTLLRSILVLRLQRGSGQIITLMIFRDSVSTQAFRRVSIAARWIAQQQFRAHDNFL